MNKKLIILCSLFTLFTSMVHSQQVSKEEAASRATEFFSGRSKIRKSRRGIAIKPSLTLSYTAKTNKENCFYVFNNSSGGFVIVSGDDVTSTDILGYSDNGTFDINDIPDNFRFWLQMYQKEISSAIKNQKVSGKQSQHRGLRNSAIRRSKALHNIEPLIQTRWNQKSPFYNLCPTDNGGTCMAGCVATAMAQVMNYWKWPMQGKGSHTYSYIDADNVSQKLTSNFSDHQYDWSLIDKRIASDFTTKAQKNAIAQLMYDCGVSVNMVYSSTSSSAYSDKISNALISYFDYLKTADYKKKNSYSAEAWKSMLYQELLNGRPIIYGGQASNQADTIGHEFICDGYESESEKFHFNWGWSGTYDGYFAIDALTPGTNNFTYVQNAIIGIEAPNFSVTTNNIHAGNFTKGQEISVDFKVLMSSQATEDVTITSSCGTLSTSLISKTSAGINDVNLKFTPDHSGLVTETVTISTSQKTQTIDITAKVGNPITLSFDETQGYVITEVVGAVDDIVEILTESNEGYYLSSISITGATTGNTYQVDPEVSINEDYYSFTMPDEPININVIFGTTTTDQHTLSWLVNGSVYTTTTHIEGNDIKMPVPTSFDGYEFVGWTTTSSVNSEGLGINFISKDTPVETDTTFYAVYALVESSGQGEQKTITFDYPGTDGWTVSNCLDAKKYYTLAQGTSISSPTISFTSIDTISVKMRTVGGASYKTLDAKFGSATIGSCSASSNTLNSYIISSIANINGTGAVTFSSQTSSNSYGPGISQIKITYTATGKTYKDYTTTPDYNAPQSYTLTWMSDGSLLTTTDIEEGQDIQFPSCPKVENYEFMGWTNTPTVNSDGEGIILIENNTIITSDTTFYAVFANEDLEFTTTPTPVLKDLTFTWVSNDETYATTTEQEGASISLPSNPVYEGYSFMGWTTASKVNTNGEGINYVDSSFVADKDTTFYAVFAKSQSGSIGEKKTLDFVYNSHQGWDLSTSLDKGSYYVINANSSITSPVINCTSVDTIIIGARTYGGKQYNTINASFCGTFLGACNITDSKLVSCPFPTIADVSGTGSIVFLPDNASASYGPGVYTIHIAYTSGQMSYSEYTTHPFTQSTAKYNLTLIDKNKIYYTSKIEEGTTLLSICEEVPTPVNDNVNYPGYSFHGWSFVADSFNPNMVSDTDTIHSDVTLYAVYSKESDSNWQQTAIVKIGDEVVITQIDDEAGPCELSSFSTTSTIYGIGSSFTTTPSGTYTYVVTNGTQNGTIAFHNKETGKYLYWPTNKNSVSEESELTDNSSWKLMNSSERGLLQNAVRDKDNKDRYLLWNKTSTRFACYTYKAHGNNSGAYYFYTMFYINKGGLKYDLEIPQVIPPTPDDDILAGIEVPACKNDGTTLLIDHTTNYNNQNVRTYCFEFDKEKNHTRWVAFRFDSNTRQVNVSRNDNFKDDPDLPSDYWISNKGFGSTTINGTSYTLDRGHICSSADRLYSEEANRQTFYMSNMSPQISNFNQGYWNNLEQHVQDLGHDANFADTLYVVKGGTIYGTDTIGHVDCIYNNDTRRVVIPKYYYMALLRVRHDEVKGDGYNAIGILANHQVYSNNRVSAHIDHVISIDSLEKITGINFFHKLQDDVENAVESMAITDDVLTDWGFTTTGNAENDQFFYHDTNTQIKLSMIDEYAYSTYYGDQRKLIPEGVSVYIAKEDPNNMDNIIMSQLHGNIIPANCGVILRSEVGGTYTLKDTKAYPTDNIEDNLLVGWSADTDIIGSSDCAFYALNYHEDTDGIKHIGFFAPKGAGNPHGSFIAKAGKAYVLINNVTPSSSPASFNLIWDEAVDIQQQYTNSSASPYIYDITGRRLNTTDICTLTKGMYIVKGKKILIK